MLIEESTLTTMTQILKGSISPPKYTVALIMDERIVSISTETTWTATKACEVRWVDGGRACVRFLDKDKWLNKMYLKIQKGQEVRAIGNCRIEIKE